jgi:hypothetical protein
MARDIFETANVLVALGGDIGMTVPKHGVTAAEIAVLQTIHGNDAILDILPLPEKDWAKRTMRVERARLDQVYSSDAKRKEKQCPVAAIYPGAAARLFQRLDELTLASVQFKPGTAPEGIDDREENELLAVQEGMLLADGTVNEDALEDFKTVAAEEKGVILPAAGADADVLS